MNLMKLAFWRDTKEEGVSEEVQGNTESNVINFPESRDQANKDLEQIFPTVYTWKYKGLLDLEEVQKFLLMKLITDMDTTMVITISLQKLLKKAKIKLFLILKIH
jgi:hypothetical protein